MSFWLVLELVIKWRKFLLTTVRPDKPLSPYSSPPLPPPSLPPSLPQFIHQSVVEVRRKQLLILKSCPVEISVCIMMLSRCVSLSSDDDVIMTSLSGAETCRQRLLTVARLPGVNPEGSAEEKLLQVSSLLPLDSVNMVGCVGVLAVVPLPLLLPLPSLFPRPPPLSPPCSFAFPPPLSVPSPSSLSPPCSLSLPPPSPPPPPPGSQCGCTIEVC